MSWKFQIISIRIFFPPVSRYATIWVKVRLETSEQSHSTSQALRITFFFSPDLQKRITRLQWRPGQLFNFQPWIVISGLPVVDVSQNHRDIPFCQWMKKKMLLWAFPKRPPEFRVPIHDYAYYVYSFIPPLPFNDILDIPISHSLKSQIVNELVGWYFNIIAFTKVCDNQLQETLHGNELISRQALTAQPWAMRKGSLGDEKIDARALFIPPQVLGEAQVIGIKERAETRGEEMSQIANVMTWVYFSRFFSCISESFEVLVKTRVPAHCTPPYTHTVLQRFWISKS